MSLKRLSSTYLTKKRTSRPTVKADRRRAKKLERELIGRHGKFLDDAVLQKFEDSVRSRW